MDQRSQNIVLINNATFSLLKKLKKKKKKTPVGDVGEWGCERETDKALIQTFEFIAL